MCLQMPVGCASVYWPPGMGRRTTQMGLSGAFLLLSQWSIPDFSLGKSPCEARAPELKTVQRPHSAQALRVWKSLSVSLRPLTLTRKEKDSSHCLFVCLFIYFPGTPSQRNVCKCIRYKEDQESPLYGNTAIKITLKMKRRTVWSFTRSLSKV